MYEMVHLFHIKFDHSEYFLTLTVIDSHKDHDSLFMNYVGIKVFINNNMSLIMSDDIFGPLMKYDCKHAIYIIK
jgi:hypothetical protein